MHYFVSTPVIQSRTICSVLIDALEVLIDTQKPYVFSPEPKSCRFGSLFPILFTKKKKKKRKKKQAKKENPLF